MMHHADDEERSERWLISYADLVTTLMVLFLALYVTELARHQDDKVKETASQAAHVSTIQPEVRPPLDLPKPDRVALLTGLEALQTQGTVTLTKSARGVDIAINSKLLFQPGEARLRQASSSELDTIAAVLRAHTHQNIMVEGHTDSTPISNDRYASNWELSAARAGAVVRYLVDNGVEPHRLAAIGRADNMPVALGDDPSARAANRRVTIYVEY